MFFHFKKLLKYFFLLWLVGFICFIGFTYVLRFKTPDSHTITCDAVVVFTGQKGRLQAAYKLYQSSHAKCLFVSGVDKGTMVRDLFSLNNNDRIELGYDARNTRTNAIETAGWLDSFNMNKNIKKICLVTHLYHMPRSLLEMHHTIKDSPFLNVLPYPLPQTYPWWRSWRSAWVIFREYHKCILAMCRIAFNLDFLFNNLQEED